MATDERGNNTLILRLLPFRPHEAAAGEEIKCQCCRSRDLLLIEFFILGASIRPRAPSIQGYLRFSVF